MNSTLHTPGSSPVFVGQGLKQRTYEECLKEGLNPNPNPPGEIHLPGTKEMEEHIRRSQAFALKALRRML